MAAAQSRGIEVVSVNPASVQGPGRATGTTRLLLDYLNGKLKNVVDATISLVDIADCTEGHLLAESRGGWGTLRAEGRPSRSGRAFNCSSA